MTLETLGGGAFMIALGAFLLWMEKEATVALFTKFRLPRPDSQVVVYMGLGFVVCGGWIAVGSPAPPVFGTVVSGITLVLLLKEIWLLRNVNAWPAAEATVISSTVDVGADEQMHSAKAVSTYAPVVRFSYTVDEREHESWNGSFDGAPVFRDMDKAKAVADRYPPGRRIPIRYCPDRPDRAYMGGSPLPKTKILVAAGFAAAFLLLLVVSISG